MPKKRKSGTCAGEIQENRRKTDTERRRATTIDLSGTCLSARPWLRFGISTSDLTQRAEDRPLRDRASNNVLRLCGVRSRHRTHSHRVRTTSESEAQISSHGATGSARASRRRSEKGERCDAAGKSTGRRGHGHLAARQLPGGGAANAWQRASFRRRQRRKRRRRAASVSGDASEATDPFLDDDLDGYFAQKKGGDAE